jgi:biofilm PGA synthesis N-glycosyltransferase PgaC
MIYLLVAVCASYIVALLILNQKWSQLAYVKISVSQPQATVIVPFRNEAKSLERVVMSLAKQSYKNFEVIFVNDHSEDDSLTLLSAALIDIELKYTVIDLKIGEGKKAAIAEGIKHSKGEIIVTTDADCWFNEAWLTSMIVSFDNQEIQMVTGPVVLEGNSFFQNSQRIEFGAILATSAALIGLGKPTMANGANLAYRKSVFLQVEGFKNIDQIPSGDDELLMMKVALRYPNGITFAKSPSAVVKTEALKSWKEFKNQRKRWASKWKVGKRLSTIFSALYVYLVQVSFLMLLGYALVDFKPVLSVFVLWFVKLLFEWLLIRAYFNSLAQKFSTFHFIVLQTFYPFYVLYFGVVSNFGNFQWKGRSFKI